MLVELLAVAHILHRMLELEQEGIVPRPVSALLMSSSLPRQSRTLVPHILSSSSFLLHVRRVQLEEEATSSQSQVGGGFVGHIVLQVGSPDPDSLPVPCLLQFA